MHSLHTWQIQDCPTFRLELADVQSTSKPVKQSTNFGIGWTSCKDVFIAGVDVNDSCEDSTD